MFGADVDILAGDIWKHRIHLWQSEVIAKCTISKWKHPRALIIWRKKYLVRIHKNKNQTCWKTFFITHSTYLRAKKSPVMLMLLFHPTGITGCLHNLLLGHVQRFCCYIYITFKHHLHTNLSSIIVNKIQLLCKRNRYLFKLIKYTILS